MVRTGEKAVYSHVANDDKECITVLLTVNAAGMVAPPMIVFKYERVPSAVASLMPPGWAAGKTESGWMTSESFFEYIANILYPWLVEKKTTFPVVLFVDGHVSHLTLTLSNFCTEKGIILVALYPNATHILQPLDVSVFHPLKSGWKEGVHDWRMKHEGSRLKKEYFAPLLKQVIENYIPPQNIRSGFKSCGLCPFDPNAVNYAKIFKCHPSNDVQKPALSQQTLLFHLNFLNTRICPDTLRQFKSSGTVWDGPVEDSSLFKLWRE